MIRALLFQCVAALFLVSAGEAAVRSFDCFDTLVGRLHGEPNSIFQAMERSIPYPGFTELRRQAEAEAQEKSLNGIYAELQKRLGLTDERRDELRAMEFQEELKNVFPICRNLHLVQDGDLVVTDSYFTEQEVKEILRCVGLQKQVRVVASYSGKKTGSVWPSLKEQHQIDFHVGDNAHSDVASPRSFGIPARRFSAADYTPVEQKVLGAGHKEMAAFMRTLRLQNPYVPGSEAFIVWNEQAQLNLPILILSSQYLDAFCQEKKYTTILFSQRGCCHWMPVFQALFPSYRSISFPASRMVYNAPSTEYLQYVRALFVPGVLIVDDQGTGDSVKKFFEKYFSTTPSLLYVASTTNETPGITHSRGGHFELLNEDRIGTLIGFGRSGPVRAELEFYTEHVDPAFTCVDLGVRLLSYYRFRPYDASLLSLLMDNLYEYTPVFTAYHVADHSSSPGTGLAVH